jgi:outer membrane protein assembly factor BamB
MIPCAKVVWPVFRIFVVLSCLRLCLRAQDWPQWGGNDPGRNLYSPAKGLPAQFDGGKFKPGTEDIDPTTVRNVKWAAKLGSQAYGNVVVSGGKVFVGTNNDSPRDSKHQGDRSILMVFDEETGEFLWQLVIPKLAAGKVNDWENLGLLSSPTIEGNRIYVVTSRCEVLCLTTEGLAKGNVGPFQDEGQYIAGPGKPRIEVGPRDADIIWRFDMMDELGVFPHNATRSHPLVLGDLLYVPTCNGMDWTHSNIPSPAAPSLIALNKHTGKLVAEDEAAIGPNILHSQWSSPSLGEVAGRQLIFYGGGDGFCYAFDPKPIPSGDESGLKCVWKVDCNPIEYRFKINGEFANPIRYPAAEGPSEIIATPVFWRNRVYVATGQDPEHGEGVGSLSCIDASVAMTNRARCVLWRNKSIHRSISTVSITPEGLLFVVDFSGFLHCLDAFTGKVFWTEDLKAHVWGSTLVADGKVYIGNEDGDFKAFAAAKEKKLLGQTSLPAPIYSTTIVANGVLYVASNTHLFAIQSGFKDTAPVNPDLETK